MLEEYFDAADDRLLDEWVCFSTPGAPGELSGALAGRSAALGQAVVNPSSATYAEPVTGNSTRRTITVRSVRSPEGRSAQAAVASIVVPNADLQAEIQRLLPELQWVPGS